MAPKNLLSNYSQLKQAIEEEDEDLIHSTLEKLLSNDKNNNQLKQLKIINQIQKGEFNKVIENTQSTHFQKIYSLYRLNKSDEALKVIESNRSELKTTSELLLSYLEAQINYRIGNYKTSSELYEKILKIEYPSKKDNIENDELLTNLSASYTMNGNFEKGIQITKQCDHNTYELSYNASCGSIGLKDYEQAEKYLEFAQKLCKVDDHNEISSILVQLAYVKYLNGQVEPSRKLFEQVFAQSKDTVAGAVAANNIVAIIDVTSNVTTATATTTPTSHHDLEAQKKLKHAYQDKLQGKLTTEQIRGVTLNNCLLQLHLGKYDECEKIVQSELIHLFNDEIPTLILSHSYFKQKKFDQSALILQKYIQNYNDNITNKETVRLVLAQYYLQQGQYKECIQLLKESQHVNEKSIQSLIIALYMKIDDMNSALEMLQQVISKLSNNSTDMIEMASELAKLQLSFKKYQQAASTYEMLIKMDSKNSSLHIAGLIEAMSFYDIDGAEKYCKDLKTTSNASVSIDEIEKTSSIISNISSSMNSLSISKIDLQSIPSSSTGTTAGASNRQADALNRGEKKKQRKKRRNKLPLHTMLSSQSETYKTRWETKKKHSSNLMGFGHQGSSDAEAQKSVLHKKGQKTLLSPEQVRGVAPSAAGAAGASKKKKKK